ncbi:hypothetical protein HPB50_019170 [Hyalomma asiaticum]|uniref:Uncharacterized protein n=1 Tax=Hyalomma asiaticum TaxID=266040 RepID=A0ACB7RVG9_HYAAI|nr:hypothetical protein HPB50_019170 [Hyalomma asiaticum]
MTDADAAASTRVGTPTEKSTERKEDATDLSQKKTLDNGGWFTAKYHNSRLIAVPQTGSEAADKIAPSQPKRRKEKLPPLPKTDFKVIIRSKNGLNISQLSTHQMASAITKACGNPNMCNEGNLLTRLRDGFNIAIISTPNMETANAVQSISSLRFGASDYAVTAYVAAPDYSCKGVIHGLDAGNRGVIDRGKEKKHTLELAMPASVAVPGNAGSARTPIQHPGPDRLRERGRGRDPRPGPGRFQKQKRNNQRSP